MDIVLPQVSDLQAPFTLRQCLSSAVQDYLGSCEDCIEDMMRRLDEKYGDTRKLVESIISEVRRFKKIYDDDSQSLIKFVDVVERGFRDLKKLGL